MRFEATATAVLAAYSASEAAYHRCLSSLNPIYPSSSNYSSASLPYNLAFKPAPQIIVYPLDVQQVSLAARCATTYGGGGLTVRSGGHSYAAGGLAGSLVVSLDHFKSIEFQGLNVNLGAGNRLGDVALSLASKNLALPHGTCAMVGIGGHASLGGYGYASRSQGLTVDTVTSYDVVLADGTIKMDLTRDSDPDLFWALKGSASSFGIITSFKVTPFALPTAVVNFILTYENLDVATSVKIYQAFQHFAAGATPQLGFGLTIAGKQITINGMYLKPGMSASMNDYNSAISALKNSLPSGYKVDEKVLSWTDALVVWAGTPLATIGVPLQHDTFYAKSSTVPSAISAAALANFFQYLQTTPPGFDWFIISDVYGGAGSAINAVSKSDSSFGHRDALIVIQFYASSTTPSSFASNGYDFVNGMQSSLEDGMGSSYGSYINYIDPRLSQMDAASLYWGSQYDRLAMLKTRYDPHNLFNGPQTIVGA